MSSFLPSFLLPSTLESRYHPSTIDACAQFEGRSQVLAEGCVATPKVSAGSVDLPWVMPASEMPRPRPLNLLAPEGSSEWPLPGPCAAGLDELCTTVKRIAVRREVLAAVWKNTPYDMLNLYMKAAKVKRRAPRMLLTCR